ncbi:hypothetical protein HC928_00630 [bacterium]|nr:hypothetical protein [bacterium]
MATVKDLSGNSPSSPGVERAFYKLGIEQNPVNSIHGRWDVPRYSVVPEINGVPAGDLFAQLQTSAGTIAEIRCTVNPGDDVVAAARLATMGLDTFPLFPGSDSDEAKVQVAADGSDGEITDVYLLVVAYNAVDTATADGVADNGTDNVDAGVFNINSTLATPVGFVATINTVYSTEALTRNITEADIIAGAMLVHLQFSSADKVRDLSIRAGGVFNGEAGDHKAIRIHAEGRSYA